MLSIRLKNDGDGDNDGQHESSETYSDYPIFGPGCEQFAVWAKTYAPNPGFARSFIDQDAVQQWRCQNQRPIGQRALREGRTKFPRQFPHHRYVLSKCIPPPNTFRPQKIEHTEQY